MATDEVIFKKIFDLGNKYSEELSNQIEKRMRDMKADDNSHYLIYQVLGIANQEGKLIDEYQNKGRFLYKYAGSFLEEASILCFEHAHEHALRKIRIPNTIGLKPKTFEIDCAVGNDAYEIKWRDATTDGDHITKEHTRLQNIHNAGYKPIRIMFYYPNRKQAIKIQETLKTLYIGSEGEYYFGESAWTIMKEKTGIDLFNVLTRIADEKTRKA
jgi:hypothetical protein